MTKVTSIAVEYKYVDNWHVFSCLDLPGLYVASADAKTAYNDVGTAIEKLLKLNYGIQCSAIPEESVASFLRKASGSVNDLPEAISSKRFALACA